LTGGGPQGPPDRHLSIERPQHEGLEARIADAIAPTIEHMGYELVRVQVSGKERPVVQIMADRADDAPFKVEDCEAISHAVGAVLDVEDPIRGEWTLEVSSAGIDRPLTRAKDWNRYAGHVAQLELLVPQDGRKRFKGIALGADAEAARLKLEDGTEASFPRSNIRRAKLVLTDELIAATAALPIGSRSANGAERESDGQTVSQEN
jgi:ribosome maturation factor RimP